MPAIIPTVTPPTTYIDTTLTPTEIPTVSPIVPPALDYTPASPDYSPTSDMEPDPSEDSSSDHIPPLLATSQFLLSTDDSSDSDTLDTPPSPTHEIPPVEPIPRGRPYCYHPNWLVHMMTARKRFGPLPTHRLAVRHSVDYSLSDYFTSDDSSRDSPSDSSSETPLNSSSDALSDSSSGYSSSDNPSPTLPLGTRSSHQLCSSLPSIPHSSTAITERLSHSSPVGPSRKRSRFPTTSISLSSPIPRALSSIRADLLPLARGLGTDSRADIEVRGSHKPHSELDIDLEIQAEIDKCITYADDLRAERIDDGVVVETPAQEEGAIEVIKSILRDQGHRIVASSQQGTVMSERITELERDNTRLRGTLDVASQRVTRL
ncbi:hypothetical protein Tco_1376872 [Tanacetum coccineum]